MINKDKLEKEKKKLNRLVKEALDNGTPLAYNNKIITHSRKVDTLIAEAQREKTRKKTAGSVNLFNSGTLKKVQFFWRLRWK